MGQENNASKIFLKSRKIKWSSKLCRLCSVWGRQRGNQASCNMRLRRNQLGCPLPVFAPARALFHLLLLSLLSQEKITIESRQRPVYRGIKTKIIVHTSKSFRNQKTTKDFLKKFNQITQNFCIMRTH